MWFPMSAMTRSLRTSKSSVKLIATDLDETLLDEKGELTLRTRDVIKRLQERGILVVPVTARTELGLPPFIQGAAAFPYVVAVNGAVVVDNIRGKILRQDLLSGELARELIIATASCYRGTTLMAGGEMYAEERSLDIFVSRAPGDPNVYRAELLKSRAEIANDSGPRDILDQYPEVEMLHFNFDVADTARMLRLLAPFANRAAITSSHAGSVEITNRQATKGLGVMHLAELLGISSEDILAIGNGENDMSMFALAGISVAMRNAPEIVKRHARYITAHSFREDGWAEFMETFLRSGSR